MAELEFGTIFRAALRRGIEPFNAGRLCSFLSLLFYCCLSQSWCDTEDIKVGFGRARIWYNSPICFKQRYRTFQCWATVYSLSFLSSILLPSLSILHHFGNFHTILRLCGKICDIILNLIKYAPAMFYNFINYSTIIVVMVYLWSLSVIVLSLFSFPPFPALLFYINLSVLLLYSSSINNNIIVVAYCFY